MSMTDEFQQIWKQYDRKLEKSMELNLRLLKEVQSQKAQSALRSLVAGRVVGIVIGIVYLWLLGVAFWYVRTQPVMAVSIGVFMACTVLAIREYIRDIYVIRGISYADDVLATQQKLAGIQSEIMRVLRISWVQLPFWSSFFVSNELLRKGGTAFLTIEIIIFVVLAGVAGFLYRNITGENYQRKKWVKGMVRGSGFGSIVRAMEFMGEIEEFKKNNE